MVLIEQSMRTLQDPSAQGVMPLQVDVEAMSTAERARFESKREKEFYSYYEPIRVLATSEMNWTDLNSPESVAQHRANSSSDKALTAFCQLAALRLDSRRAMIFFFDSKYAYVLAEATRTLSLQDDDLYKEKDELWLGATKIPRGFSVCEHTVNLPINGGSNAGDVDSDIVHIVNNLSEDTRFCDRPYVTGGPRARFYAGVPIQTQKGHNIGAFYSILDDKPRKGLEPEQTRFLQDMASAVMSHLEMIRAQAEQKRGSMMIKALSAFMADTSSACGRSDEAFGLTAVRSSSPDAHETKSTGSQPVAAPDHILGQGISRHTAYEEDAMLQSKSLLSLHIAAGENERSGGPTDDNRPPPSRNTSSETAASSQESDEPVSEAIQAAADLIRKAVDADGVLFLDASISSFGGLANAPALHTSSDHDHELSTSGTEGAASDTDPVERLSSFNNAEQHCPVLGASYGQPHNHTDIPQKLLQSLLRYYKRGRIFNYEAEDETTSDNNTSEGHSATEARSTATLPTTNNASNAPSVRKRKRPTKLAVTRDMQLLFPDARSLMLLGLWDSSRQRWYAGCIVWSNSPFRVFSPEFELNYLTAFCDVTMARVARLHAEMANKVKSDFLSSISHELRSPLHGILGTAEFLQEQINDHEISEMVTQIEACGNTLMDVIDHLLEFSKVNSFLKTKKTHVPAGADNGSRSQLLTLMDKREDIGGMTAGKSIVSLDKLTEEVIDTAVYSFCCSKDSLALSQRKVTVITDVDVNPEIPMKCRISVGAWKRLCINLINNALKYTEEGYIVASLKMIPPCGRQKRPRARLTITDSGRGMSKDFLAHQLFRAFAQEDSLSEGTGLGMSMVAKIVKSLKGTVDVQSTKDVGTVVSVIIPLEIEKGTGEGTQQPPLAVETQPMFMHLLGASDTEEQGAIGAGRRLQDAALRKACHETNVVLSAPSWSISGAVDLVMVHETDVPKLIELLQASPTNGGTAERGAIGALQEKRFLVICNNCRSLRDMEASSLQALTCGRVEFVAQPCGPRKLASAIRKCLGSSAGNSALQTWSRELDAPQTQVTKASSDHGSGFPEKATPRNTDAPLRPHKVRGQPESNMLHTSMSLLVAGTADGGMAATPRPKSPIRKTTKTQTKAIIDPSKPVMLLVDDNAINLQLLVAYAKKHGHQKLIATNGREAVDAYKAATLKTPRSNEPTTRRPGSTPIPKPEVVLMDISMPVMNGFEAARHIRAFEKDSNITPATIIALTGLGSADAQREAFASGVDLFLTKPVKLNELTKLLKNLRQDTD